MEKKVIEKNVYRKSMGRLEIIPESRKNVIMIKNVF